MSLENCDLKSIPCPRSIKTTEGEDTTLSYVHRLSARGKSEDPIDTRSIAADYIFKQTGPKEIIELYASKPILGIIPRYSCDKCTQNVRLALQDLDLA